MFKAPWAAVAPAGEVLGSVFNVLLVVTLFLMVLHTYFMTRRPVLLHLREIYFINNVSFRRAWYLVICGMTLFVFSRGLLEGERLGALRLQPGTIEVFEVIFGSQIGRAHV